jgi:hypothetical protein
VDERFADLHATSQASSKVPRVDKYGRRLGAAVDEDDSDGAESSSDEHVEAATRSAGPGGGTDSDSEGGDGGDDTASLQQQSDQQEDGDVEWGDSFRRLAVLDCDWTRMSAVDLLVILRSFTPPCVHCRALRGSKRATLFHRI